VCVCVCVQYDCCSCPWWPVQHAADGVIWHSLPPSTAPGGWSEGPTASPWVEVPSARQVESCTHQEQDDAFNSMDGAVG